VGRSRSKSSSERVGAYWSVRMRKTIGAPLLFLLVIGAFGGAAAQSPSNQPRASGMETDVAKIKEAMLGNGKASPRRYGRARTQTVRSSRSNLKRSYNICRPIGSS